MPAPKTPTVPGKNVQSFVKKEQNDKADAKRAESFFDALESGPERISIEVCDCCVKVG